MHIRVTFRWISLLKNSIFNNQRQSNFRPREIVIKIYLFKQVKQDKYCFCWYDIYIERQKQKKRGKTTLFSNRVCYRNNRLRCYKQKTAGSWLGQNMLKYLTHKLRTQSINEDNVQEKVRIKKNVTFIRSFVPI